MTTGNKELLEEASAVGRVRAATDAIYDSVGKGMRRSAPDRRALWDSIAMEAATRAAAISPAAKPRAPRAAKTPKSQPELPNAA